MSACFKNFLFEKLFSMWLLATFSHPCERDGCCGDTPSLSPSPQLWSISVARTAAGFPAERGDRHLSSSRLYRCAESRECGDVAAAHQAGQSVQKGAVGHQGVHQTRVLSVTGEANHVHQVLVLQPAERIDSSNSASCSVLMLLWLFYI